MYMCYNTYVYVRAVYMCVLCSNLFCYRLSAVDPTCASGFRKGPRRIGLKEGGFPSPFPES